MVSKKPLSVILSVVLTIGLCPLPVYADTQSAPSNDGGIPMGSYGAEDASSGSDSDDDDANSEGAISPSGGNENVQKAGQLGSSDGDGSGGYEDDLIAHVLEVGQHQRKLFHPAEIALSLLVGQGRGSYFYDDTSLFCAHVLVLLLRIPLCRKAL